MADYVELLKDKRTGNWFKLFIACFITKQGLEKFVDSGLMKFHEDIYTRVFKTKKIPEGTECHQCKPQKIFCKNPQPCEHGICDEVHEMVAREHALKTPSWSNTQCWMSSYWEVAKCFLPSSGYRENTGVKDTDFNGIVSLMIHCKHFQNSLSFYIADEKSVLSKARGIGRLVRHAAELAITDQDMDTHFNVLLKLLEDPKCLLQDPAAQTAARNIRLLHDDNLEFLSGDNGDMLRELTNQQKNGLILGIQCQKGNFQNEMIQYYQNRLCTMPLSPLMPNRNGKLREFCVPLKIKRIGKDGKKLPGDETIQNYRSMLESAVETEASKCIVVQGEPGAGKTTFALGTLLDWCDAIATSHDSKLKVDIIDRKQKANDSDAKLKPDTCDASLKTDSSDLSIKADTRVANFNVDISDSKTNLGNSDVKPKADTCDAKLKAANCIANLNARLCVNKTFVGIDSDRYQYFVDVDALNQFKFAFYIPLRHVIDIFEVDKMIKKILIDKLYRSEDQRSNALRLIQDLLSHESCLVLFDGLDEWSHSCYIVPETNLGSNCVCIILTRPWRLAELPVSDFDVHSRLKITGITDERLLIKRVLKCLDDKGGPLYENINALFYEIIEKSLDLSSPIILMQLICIWHEKRTLGDSLCGIYASMLEMLLKRTELKGQTIAQNNMQFNCFKNKRFVQKNADLIAALSKLAFRQTFSEARETNILFGFDDVEACLTEDQIKLTLSSGILSEESTYSLCEDTQTFYFLHKTFQEFFAAMFIVTNKSDKTVFQRIKSCYQRFETFHVLEISQVFVFVCGLDAKVGYDISQWLVDVIFNKGINKGINLYRLSQEKHEAVKPDVKAVRLLHNAMAAGFKEARANNQTDIELSPEHYQFSIVITNSASMECTLLRQPLRIHKLCIICDYNLINEDGLRTVLQESSCSMHMVETYTERWRDERRLSTRKPVLNNMTTFALYKSTCVVNFININASASSDEFLQKPIIWTLLQTICKLPNLTEIFIEDINLVCVRNRAGATAPEHVRICLPCTVRLVNLNRVRMTEETWRQLRKDITGIKHKVKFEAIRILPCCTYLVTLQSCV